MTARSRTNAMEAKPIENLNNSNSRSIEGILGGISLKALEGFCRRMATGLRTGVDLLRMLDLEAKSGTVRHREVAKNLSDQLRAGSSLSDAMNHQGHYFPKLLIKMVDAGEHAGGLDRVFREMADYYQDLKKTRSDFLAQISWPVIQLCLAIFIGCIVILVNGFFKAGSPNDSAFDLTGVGLRGISGVLLFLILVGIFFSAIGLVGFGIWKNWFGCHKTLMPLMRNVPVIGQVITTTALSRLSMTLSMMLGAGVDAKRSVRDAILSTGNFFYISGLKKTLSEIEKGKSFSEALDAPKLLPEEFIQTVAVGEMSGSDSESLERMAVVYREKAQLALKQLAVLAGVAIWLLIAAMIIAAIFMIFFQVLKVYSGASDI
jgi:type IV pilus assembly protein PilC